MRKLQRCGGVGIIALGLGAGCAGTAATPAEIEPPPVEKVEQSIQTSLDRLTALHIIDGAKLVLNLSAEASACYGLPCPGLEAPYQAERARQAPRLERLVELAESAARDPLLAPRDASEANEAIRALNGLAVVEGASLVEAQPRNNPECYNLPCLGDIDAAGRVTGQRVATVFAIVDAWKDSP